MPALMQPTRGGEGRWWVPLAEGALRLSGAGGVLSHLLCEPLRLDANDLYAFAWDTLCGFAVCASDLGRREERTPGRFALEMAFTFYQPTSHSL